MTLNGRMNTVPYPILSTACAAEAIALAVKKFPDMSVGAGTVINAKQCKEALKAGAQFIVSPGLSAR